MGRTVDIDVLLGFIEEAHGYMPGIRQGIERLPLTEDNRELVEDARRFVHIIKGASSMVGFAGLSHITYYMEEVLEDLLEEEMPYSEATAPFLLKTLDYVEQYLAGDMLEDHVDETPMLTDVTRAYRRLRGLPVDEDETAVAAVLAEVERAAQEAEEEFADEWLGDEGADDQDIAAFYMDEDLLPELLEAFAPEAEDHLRTISTQLTLLDKEPQNKEVLRVIRRTVHTLKGAAATVGLQAVADLSHRMEDLLDLVDDDSVAMSQRLMQLLFASSDMLEDMVAGHVDEAAVAALMTRYEQPLGEDNAAIPTLEPLKIADLLGPEMVFDLGSQRASEQRTAPAAVKKPQTAVNPDEVIRVPLERLNELVRLASELIITRTTFEQRLGDLNRLTNELQPSIDRLRRLSTRLETQYEVAALASTPLNAPPANRADENGRSATSNNGFVYEFDELEFDRYTEFHLLSRELAETTSDIRLVGNELNHLIGDFEGVIENQGRISSELQDKLMRTRMLPFATLTTRLQRAVRVVAQKQGKQVDLVIEGEEVELDKKVLDDIADPLLHVLRNAVDHGIEPPELRQVLGKPARGQIQLRAYYQGNQVVIQVKDDGAGLQPERIRAKAISQGYVSEGEARTLTEAELHSLIFAPGFSTADKVDELSGRGVGLDVLRSNVYKLKGTVAVDSKPGQYMIFTIRLPMTLAMNRALLVKANHETFAIPLNAVDLISRIERTDISHLGDEPVVRLNDNIYPLLQLGELLHLKQPADENIERVPVLVLNAGSRQMALMVDEILEGREIVVKPLGNHLRYVHGVTGATLMGDGRPVLILNPAELMAVPTQAAPRRQFHRPSTTTTQRSKPLSVLVVDDSVSVRRVVTNLVKSVGWEALAAKDGVEALEMLQSSITLPDAILMDIEMPRMDGYELAATLKANQHLSRIPIVMLTSRAGEKHRRKALELGVSAYLVKPYSDDVLINTVRTLAQA